MAIRYACTCGKVYDVPDKNAGKRARCSACQQIHVIPGIQTAAAADPPALVSSASPPPILSPRTKPACPKCQSENFQRFAILYESGSTVSTSIGVGFARVPGGYAEGVFGSTTLTHTALAGRVAPPEELSETGATAKCACGIIMIIIAIYLLSMPLMALVGVTSKDQASTSTANAYACVGVIAVPLIILGGLLVHVGQSSLVKIRQYNKEVWPEKHSLWLRSYLCLRCGFGWSMK